MTALDKMTKLMLFLLVAILLASCGSSDSDKAAPQFELTDLHGNTVKLAQFSGEKIYIKFWTSWCSICLAGLEELNELAAEQNDFTVLTIVHPNYKGEQSTEDLITWFESLDFEHIPILLDEKGVVTEQFRVMAYPSSFYINTNQVIAESTLGHQTNEEIKQVIKKIN